MYKKPFYFLLFSFLSLSFSIGPLFSIEAMSSDSEEEKPLRPSSGHSINIGEDTDTSPRCSMLRRIICCGYICPACCSACIDPDIIETSPDGIPIYNSNTKQSIGLTPSRDPSTSNIDDTTRKLKPTRRCRRCW